MKTTILSPVLAIILLAGAICDADATSFPPGAVTLPATIITPSQATLNGMVNPHGQAASAYFRYGLDTNYGSISPTMAVATAFYPPNPGGLAFNGTNQNATVPGFGNYAPTNEVTIEFWQNVAQAQPQSTFILNPDNSADRINCHAPWEDGTVYWDFGNIVGAGRLAYATNGVTGVWNHFALVASQSGNSMTIYRNGALEAHRTGMTPFQHYASDLLLAGGTVSSYYFKGVLSEFRVWNTALDQSTILSWMNRTLTNTHPAWSNLVAYWPMNEGGGAVLNDHRAGMATRRFLSNAPVWMAVTSSPVSITVTGLSAATTYHYQLVATNIGSLDAANDLTFTTPSVAGITWHAPSTITGDGDVYAVGAPVYAYDWADASVVVNGVSFAAASGAGGNVGTTFTQVNPNAFNSSANPFNSLSAAYQSMLVGGAYNNPNGDTVTLNNLVSGHPYAVQVWVNDPRGPENGRTETLTSAGGNAVTLNFTTNSGSAGGIPGQFAIGYFTASSSTEAFTVIGNSVDQINALQVRDLSVVSGRPIVTTGIAGNFKTTGATLNATVNPNGFGTTAWFQWGTSTNYGNVTGTTKFSAGIDSLAVSENLTGLMPGIIYHFAVTAVNSAGTNMGADQTFSVPAPLLESGATPVLYSTFGPNHSYSYLVESRYAAYSFYIAMPFTPGSSTALGQILVPVYNVIPPSQIRFTLTTDNGGVPGSTLESLVRHQPDLWRADAAEVGKLSHADQGHHLLACRERRRPVHPKLLVDRPARWFDSRL